jgi:hypothetical protein
MVPRAIRLYDKNSKKMVYPKQGNDQGVFVGMDGYPMQFDGKNFFKLDQCIPMYATGMMSKNGAMIWEGDIIECDMPLDFGGMVSWVKKRGVMNWDIKGGKWFINIKSGTFSDGMFQVTNSVVIGDIYQHKHLLKDEQEHNNSFGGTDAGGISVS